MGIVWPHCWSVRGGCNPVKVVSCSVIHTPRWRMSGGLIWISCLERVPHKCMIIVPRIQLSDMFSVCCSICCVALPSSSQQHFLTIEASVAGEKSWKLPDFGCQPWAKTADDILPSHKLTSRFVVAQSLKEQMHRVLSSTTRSGYFSLQWYCEF